MPTGAASPAPQPQFASPHAPILLVEDDDGIRASLRFFFEGEAYSIVAEVATMAEAAEYLSSTQLPHVVLLDFRNPQGDADMLLRVVERDAALQRHRYILTPASDITLFSADAQRLITALCTAVVYKPYDLGSLLTAIQRAAAQLPASSS